MSDATTIDTPEVEPQAPSDPYAEARAAGYGWGEIFDHVATASDEALRQGYSQDEIDQHLGFRDPKEFLERAKSGWASTIAGQPQILDGLSGAQPELDLTQSPTLASDYARAILNKEVKGPQDFADHYAAAALDAAHNIWGLDDSNLDAVRARQFAGAAAADALAPTLPANTDLTDAALSLATPDGIPLPQIKDNLLANWQAIGQHPLDAAMKASTDPDLADQLSSVPMGASFGDQVSPEVGEAIGNALVGHLRAVGKDWQDFFGEQSTFEAKQQAELGRNPSLKAIMDYQAAHRGEPGNPSDIAFNLALGTGPGPIERVGARLASLFRGGEPRVTSVDPAAAPGLAVTDKPISEAMATPAPAERVAPETPTEGAAPEPTSLKFAEDATPAGKLQALARDLEDRRLTREGTLPDEFDRPNFFQNLAKDQDKATQDLARGYDATASFSRALRDVWWDESGSLPRGETPAPAEPPVAAPGSRAAIRAGKDYAEDLIRKYGNGLTQQKSEWMAHQLEQFFPDFAPHMPEWTAALEKSPKSAGETTVGAVLNAMDGRGVVDANSPLSKFASFWANEAQRQRLEYQKYVDEGITNPMQFRDAWIPHVVDRSDIGRGTGSGRTGSMGFTRERTYDTIPDLVADGHKLKYPHPLLNVMAAFDAREKALQTLRMQNIAREAEWMKFYPDTNEGRAQAKLDGYEPIGGIGATKTNPRLLSATEDAKAREKALAKMSPEDRALHDEMAQRVEDFEKAPSLTRDEWQTRDAAAAEQLKVLEKNGYNPATYDTQQLFAREGLARNWENWRGYDMRMASAKLETALDLMQKIKNGSTYLKLMFPGYHTLTEYKNGMANGLSNVVDEIAKGEFRRGVWDLAKYPIKPIEYIKAGAKYRTMYRAMEADPALDAFVAGGGNIGGRQKIYAASNEPSIWKLWQRGQLGQELWDDVRKAFTLPEIRGGEGNLFLRATTDAGRAVTFPLREAARLVTWATAPVWDHAIPLLKAGAAIERIQTFIRQGGEGLSDTEVRAFARRVVTNIDDRFGEYNSANLFWNPMVKRVANQTMLSTGWTYGTVHATIQGIAPLLRLSWDRVATTNLMAQLATIAFTNGVWSMLVDPEHRLPRNTLDYLLPFANMANTVRMLVPGEEKEYWDWWKIAAGTYGVFQKKGWWAGAQKLSEDVGQYAKGKLAPIWQAAWAWMSGEDQIGRKIRDVPGGVPAWLEQQFLPIFAANWPAMQKTVGNAFAAVGLPRPAFERRSADLGPALNTFGFREAPKYGSQIGPWLQSQGKLEDRWTKEELQRARKFGDNPDLPSATGGGGGSRGGGSSRGGRTIEPGTAYDYLRGSRGGEASAAAGAVQPGSAYDYLRGGGGGGRAAGPRSPLVTPQGAYAPNYAPQQRAPRARGNSRRRRQ